MNRTITFAIFTLLFLLASCTETVKEAPKLQKEQIRGETMGTTFLVSYWDSTGVDFTDDLWTLLLQIDSSVSTYKTYSEISTFNQKSDSLIVRPQGHFARNYALSKTIYTQTEGWFNPCVMPLVNYWGFGYKAKKIVQKEDKAAIEALLKLVQFDAVDMQELANGDLLFIKTNKGIELDFSAIAKGDGVDQVGLFLEGLGIENYFVEIGGEVRARGEATPGFPWKTGIRTPKEKGPNNELQIAVNLPNLSLATSGNYENYHEDKNTGLKYAHTINPHTGYPEKNTLLSASVFAQDCATADAFATAFMAMGLEKAFALAEKRPELEGYFIYSDAEGNLKEKYTPGAAAYLILD